jgi:dTDP-4-dehydrorhamnose reductase
MTNVDACQANEKLAFFSNVVLPEKLAVASFALGLKFVHISSDHIFSGKGSMWLENDLPNPINAYARSKLFGEKAVLEAYSSSLVIRTNFFGWGPPYRPSFSDVVINALRSGKKLHLFQDVFFTPLLTEILIEDVHELIELGAVGVYHVSGDDRLSKLDFGLRLAQIFDLDQHLITPSSLSARRDLAPRPLDLSLDNSKLRGSVRYKCRSLATQFNRLRESEPHSPRVPGLPVA